MVAGKMSPDEVLAEVAKKGLTENEEGMFFANYYAGLEEDLRGRRARALELLGKAVASPAGRDARGGAGYMWQVARLHWERLRAAKELGLQSKVAAQTRRTAANSPAPPEATRAPASSAGRRRPHSGRVLHPEFAATRKKVAWTSVQAGVIKSAAALARRNAALCQVVGTECPGGT